MGRPQINFPRGMSLSYAFLPLLVFSIPGSANLSRRIFSLIKQILVRKKYVLFTKIGRCFQKYRFLFKKPCSSDDVQLRVFYHELLVFQNNTFTTTIFEFLPLKRTQRSQYFKQTFGKKAIKCHRFTRQYFLSLPHC